MPEKLSLRSGLLADPVVERSHLLDILLLGGILLLRSDVDLLLHAVGCQRALVLEGAAGDVVVIHALRTEADVYTLHVGVGIPLAFEDGLLGDTLLGALDRGPEDTESVDLDGVALCDQLNHTGCHLHEHALDDVATVHTLVLAHVLGQASQGDGLLLDGLGVVLTVAGVVGVDVLTNVNQKLWILYHSLI